MVLITKQSKWRKRVHSALCVIGCLFLMTGCGTWGQIKDATNELFGGFEGLPGFSGRDDVVKQTIALIPFGNQMPWMADQLHMEFMAQLADALEEKCPRIILVTPGGERYPWELSQFISSGAKQIDNIALAEICRKAGINGVIRGELAHIGADEVSQGLLWFKGTYQMARTQLEVAVYHAGTAAKLLDETFYLDVGLSEADYNTLKKEKIFNASATEDQLVKTAAAAASAICKKLKDVVWEGNITSVSSNNVHISFGDVVGLSEKDVLTVYEKGALIEGVNGSRYIVPGLKIGEIEIVAISTYDAQCVILENSAEINVGDVVRVKTD